MRPASGNASPSFFQRFVHSEVGGSVVLLVCSVSALVWANSPWADSYFALIRTYVGLSWAGATFEMSLQHWVNDGLMVLFFFVVGLEVKREVSVGELSSFDQAALPASAALGGMAIPALLYAAFNLGGEGVDGWGIPMATDIAFALGVLALFGKRVPLGLKVFLTALAIVDDIGAVLVIALFYTEQISWVALLVAGGLLALLRVAARARRYRIYVLAPLALGVWIAVLASGVHATVAGILVALVVPVRARLDPTELLERSRGRLAELESQALSRESMLRERRQLEAIEDLHGAVVKMRPAGLTLEAALHPIQAFFVLPLFALFNAGVALGDGFAARAVDPIALGIVVGLVVGKPIGAVAFAWLAVRSGRATLPVGVSWGQVLGAGFLAGIGFTMSLFISELAFADAALVGLAKVGILVASLIAGVGGFLVLHRVLPRERGS